MSRQDTQRCPTPMRHSDGTVSRCVLDSSHNLADSDHRDCHGHTAPVLVRQESIRQVQVFYDRQREWRPSAALSAPECSAERAQGHAARRSPVNCVAARAPDHESVTGAFRMRTIAP